MLIAKFNKFKFFYNPPSLVTRPRRHSGSESLVLKRNHNSENFVKKSSVYEIGLWFFNRKTMTTFSLFISLYFVIDIICFYQHQNQLNYLKIYIIFHFVFTDTFKSPPKITGSNMLTFSQNDKGKIIKLCYTREGLHGN